MGRQEKKNRSLSEKEMLLDGVSLVVSDMDGTLYGLDGPGGKFSGSTLERRILGNARDFVVSREPDDASAEAVFQAGLADRIGLSNVCSQRYGITRSAYFSEVWDVDPKDAVITDPGLPEALRAIRDRGIRLMLLTGAPSVWEKRVIGYLGLEDVFGSVRTGESFGVKTEVFGELASRGGVPGAILSIGDQDETDIVPARMVGMRTLQISGPGEIVRIFGRG